MPHLPQDSQARLGGQEEGPLSGPEKGLESEKQASIKGGLEEMDEGNGTGTSLQEGPRQEVGSQEAPQCPACAAGRPVNPDGTHTIDRNIIPCPDGDKCQLCKGPILTRYQYAMALESHFRAKLLRLMARWDRGSLKYGPLCLKGCTRKDWEEEREDEFDDAEAYLVIRREARQRVPIGG